MNDEFLIKYRKAPRPVFAAALYKKISTPAPARSFAAGKYAWGALFTVLLVAALAAFSVPAVRAAALRLVESIGGLWFDVSGRVEPIDPAAVRAYPVTSVALETLRAGAPFAVRLPAWIPDGYTPEQDTGHASDYSWVAISWTNAPGAVLLVIQQPSSLYGQEHPVPVGSLESLAVNGQPAAFMRGMWVNETGQWDPDAPVLALTWRKDALIYTLTATHSQLSSSDLVRMAESIP